jgi:hypothetical protein
MEKLVDDDEPREQQQESRQGHRGRNVSQRRDEKPKRCHHRCRDDTDWHCEKILKPRRRRLAQ